MPEIHSDTIAQVIALAREIDESTLVGAHDGMRDPGAGSMAMRELKDFVANLTEEEQYSLVAVMWIGRDSFDAEDYDEAYATAQQAATNATENYLAGIPMLADYLESGLEALGIAPSEADKGVY